MQHDVRAVLDRPIEEGRRERVVYDERHSRRVRHVGDGAQIGYVESWIADGLHVHCLCRLVDRSRERRRVVSVHEARRDPEPREGVLEEGEGAAVERRRGDDGITRLREIEERERLRRLPARRRDRRHSALEIGDPLLEGVGGGIHDAGVDVSELLEAEQAGGVLRAVEDVTRGGVDGDGAGVRRRVGFFLADVNRAGSKPGDVLLLDRGTHVVLLRNEWYSGGVARR